MDTWSSVAALVDKESTEEGWHKTLFSETEVKIRQWQFGSGPQNYLKVLQKSFVFFNSVNVILIYRVHQPNAAAVQCAIMKPELSPPSLTRKAGSSLREGLHNLSILLSLIEANSWTAIDKKSRAYEKRKCDARSQKNYHKHSKKNKTFLPWLDIRHGNFHLKLSRLFLQKPSWKSVKKKYTIQTI